MNVMNCVPNGLHRIIIGMLLDGSSIMSWTTLMRYSCLQAGQGNLEFLQWADTNQHLPDEDEVYQLICREAIASNRRDVPGWIMCKGCSLVQVIQQLLEIWR